VVALGHKSYFALRHSIAPDVYQLNFCSGGPSACRTHQPFPLCGIASANRGSFGRAAPVELQ
jgi:hypothetical protein